MSKAIISDTVQAVKSAPAAPVAVVVEAPAPRPNTIRITESSHLAFAIAAVHIRQGYRFSVEYSPEVYASHGQSSILLELGNPSPEAVTAAEASIAHAIEVQRAEFDRQVEQAARQMVEDAARKAKQEQLAADLLEAKNAVRRLQAAAAAA